MRAPLIGLACSLSLSIASAASGITIDWTSIGNPANPADTEVLVDGTTGYGSVPYAYNIGTYEVTNAQYTAFLNAVAKTDTNGLYDPNMALASQYGGITRSGISAAYLLAD